MQTTYIGIDPGPRYTAVSVITDNVIVLSTTFKRPDDLPAVTWAVQVTQKIVNTILPQWPEAKIGIEGVTDPQAYFQGKKNLINPKHLIRLGLVVGAIASAIPTAVIVRPGKNGSGTTYPEELTGRRPKTLPGEAVGTRNHERSAYDVAQQVERLIKEGYTLDMIKGIFDE